MGLELSGADWAGILGRLGGPAELDRSARESGALRRRRLVRDGPTLLRLCLGYGCGLSLREVSAWSGMTQMAAISDVAVLKRLRGTADWLARLAGDLVAGRLPQPSDARPIRIVDGSMIRGPEGGLWRLHVAYDLAERRFTDIELTDHRIAEKLERAPVAAGEIRIGDRCYAKPEGVRQLCAEGGDFVLRIGWKSLCLSQPDGTSLDLPKLLGEASREAPTEMPVHILNGRKRHLPPIKARLIIIAKPPAAAERSRKRARKASRKGCNVIQPATLCAADFIMLVTSLDPQTYSTAEVAALYRLRWQVELAFKRLKSLIDFSRLPAKDPGLARTWLLSKLLMALILEDLNQELLDSPPCANCKTPPSLALAANQDALPNLDRSGPGHSQHGHTQKSSPVVAQRTRRTRP